VSVVPILDALVARLTVALPAGTAIGDVSPADDAGLPAVALELIEIEQALVGIGRIPRATRRGALAVNVAIDLADPVLDLGGGETLSLLSPDRRTVTLPHGPVVRSDGASEQPFTGTDVVATDPNPFTVVTTAPTGRQLRVDADLGTLEFGIALAATGTLRVQYFIGQWDTTVTRHQGTVLANVTAEQPADVSALVRQIATAFDATDPTVRLRPAVWQAAVPGTLGDTGVRTQTVGFHFDAELEDPVLTSGGGVISTVEVTGRLTQDDLDTGPFDGVEEFDVTREGA
jgi:hypothetical protein